MTDRQGRKHCLSNAGGQDEKIIKSIFDHSDLDIETWWAITDIFSFAIFTGKSLWVTVSIVQQQWNSIQQWDKVESKNEETGLLLFR